MIKLSQQSKSFRIALPYGLAVTVKPLVRHITGWTRRAERESRPAPPTPENIAALMELHPVGERFFQEFMPRQVLLNAASNGAASATAT